MQLQTLYKYKVKTVHILVGCTYIRLWVCRLQFGVGQTKKVPPNSVYPSTKLHIPEDPNVYSHHREDIKSRIKSTRS